VRIRTVLGFTALLALFVITASAADVSGKWTASTQGRDGKAREVVFNFKVDGENLTGTVSGRTADREISEGKVAGNDISFAVKMTMGGNEVKMQYKGTVTGDEIKFTVQRDGADRTTMMTAKRSS
jgi:hypothetical protein